MSKDNRTMTNPALLSIAQYLNEKEDSQKDEVIQEKLHYNERKEPSRRIKITLKESEKARLSAIAQSQYLPLATFCTQALMEYADYIEKK